MTRTAGAPKVGRVAPNASWPVVRLGDATTKIGSGSTPRGGESVYQETGIPLIRSMNVHFGGFKADGLAHIDDAEAEKLNNVVVNAGDVLLNITGASIGRVTTAPNEMHGARVNQHVCIIRPKPEISSRFLALFFASPEQQARVMNVQVGATRQALTKAMIERWEIPVPPLPEQRRIVAEIEKQFTRLDAGVAALRRVQANLKRYRAAVLQAACSGRLVPTEAALARKECRTFETGEQLLQRILVGRLKNSTSRNIPKEPIADETAARAPLPEGWTWTSIEQVTANFDGKRVPLKAADRDKRSGRYPYYGASGIIDDIDEFIFDGEFLLIAEDGANLLSRSTPIAFRATGKFWVNNHAHVVQTLGGIPLSYLETFLNGTDLTFSVTGSAQPKLTQAALNKLPIPLPPLAEQKRTVAEVDRRLSVIEELETLATANLARAIRLRQAVLKSAFSENT